MQFLSPLQLFSFPSRKVGELIKRDIKVKQGDGYLDSVDDELQEKLRKKLRLLSSSI